MNTQKLIPIGIRLALTFAVAHFIKNDMVKAAAFGVMGTIVAKQIPYVKNALA